MVASFAALLTSELFALLSLVGLILCRNRHFTLSMSQCFIKPTEDWKAVRRYLYYSRTRRHGKETRT